MVVPTVTNFVQAVLVSLAAALMTFLSFIPALIGAVIVIVAGWLISGFVARLSATVLERTGFDMAAHRTGVTEFIARTGMRDARASVVLAELVKWFIRLIFLEAAAAAIHLQAVVQVINQIVLFIPNLVVALVVLMIGVMVARLVGGLVRGSASEAGLTNPNLVAAIARYAVIVFAVIVAVNQVGIAATLVNTLFMGVVAALALALGLAFGLGGRDVAGRMWQSAYERGRQAAPRLESAAQAASAREAAPATARQADVEYGSAPETEPAPGYPADLSPSAQPPRRRSRMRPSME